MMGQTYAAVMICQLRARRAPFSHSAWSVSQVSRRASPSTSASLSLPISRPGSNGDGRRLGHGRRASEVCHFEFHLVEAHNAIMFVTSNM